ncbi:hypothetical protein KI387_008245 [Taxus chinensis]|uniref:WRC domain-containing protein n=1 Tax=Taxus chinensis TaxID=29808 RepID=A0AA38CPZ8_TAXCH|nr:hypothetical protein KI387_008245 [Taxus chinensis]
MSNPWLNNSRWMKTNYNNSGGRDLSEQSEFESEMSNNDDGEYQWVLGKKMNSLREELQWWKIKCVKMEEGFKMEKERWKAECLGKQAEFNGMKDKLDQMGEDLEKSKAERGKMEDGFKTEKEKWTRLFLAKHGELNRMKDKLDKMGDDLEKSKVEREKLEIKSIRLDKLIKELEKLGMTGLVNEFDTHTLSVDKFNRSFRDSEGCSVSDSKEIDRLMDVGIDDKGKVREMTPQAEVFFGLSQKDEISQCNIDELKGCSVSDSEDIDRLMDVGIDDKGKVREVKPHAEDKISQCNIDELKDVGIQVKRKFTEANPQNEVSLTSFIQKDKISRCNNTDNEDIDRLKHLGMQVKGKLREMKFQGEISPTSVGQKDKLSYCNNTDNEDINGLKDVGIPIKGTITTQTENRIGETMLKQGFEDFDRWMGVEPDRKLRGAKNSPLILSKVDKISSSKHILEGTPIRPHNTYTIPLGERGGKTQEEEQEKSGEDAELQGVSEEVEIQVRCNRNDGKQWRCSFPALPGSPLCHKHYAQRQLSKNRKVECNWGNAKKPRSMSNITEGKPSLTIVAKQQQGEMKKCKSEDEEEDIYDSEEEPPKKKKSRLKEEEEEDPDYSPTVRRKQKYEKIELLPIGSVTLDTGHENFRKGSCSDSGNENFRKGAFLALGSDNFTADIRKWEQKDLVSRDGQMKLSTQVLFASFDQRSERAGGESACSALVTVIADWLHKNKNSMPTKARFDTLIREGSLEWRKLCQIQAYKQRFPDRHFDLETVLEAKVCPLSLAPDKSFVGFFQPEKMGDSFEFLRESMSFDNIWEEITNGTHAMEAENSGPKVYIVIWNDHFFLLKVEKEAYYIIDTLGERLFEGCNQAYILKFDKSTAVYQLPEEAKSSTTTQSISIDISKSNGNKLQQGNTKNRNTSPVEIADSNDVEGKLICKGKESCKEFIKGFWAALTLRELEIDIKRGLLGGIQPYQRLQIEFHFTVCSSSTSMELIAG